MKRLVYTLFSTTMLFGLFSCETELPQASQTLVLDLPATPYSYKQSPGDTFRVINDNKATLGRVLFYDRQLSINNSLACASCHKQNLAFADNARFSKGFGSKLTNRNSMPIQDLGFSNAFIGFDANRPNTSGNLTAQPALTSSFINFSTSLFWDGREKVLSEMVLRPIVNHVEMGINDLSALEQKLANVSYYPALFDKAYGSPEVTTAKVADALAAFLGTISATNTRLDKVNRNETTLTPLELKGQALFFTKYDCNSCHQVGSPNGYIFAGTFANIGLDENDTDEGVAGVTRNPADVGKFKIPSLRNVALTAPYMHDGRFETLEEVIEHYSDGMEDNPNLDPRLREAATGKPKVMNISAEEKKAIIAFLHTLTDHTMINDVRFSDPFKVK